MVRNNLSVEKANFTVFDIETTGLTADSEITTVVLHLPNGVMQSFVNLPEGDLYNATTETDVQNYLNTRTGEEVDLVTFDSEKTLLEGLCECVFELGSEAALAAYRGENWKGGFDLPHARTRSQLTGAPFPFEGLWYLDVYDVFGDKKRFNTKYVELPSSLNKSPMLSFLKHIGVVGEDRTKSEWTAAEMNSLIDNADYTEADIKSWARETDQSVPTKSRKELDEIHDLFFDNEPDPTDYDPFDDSAEAVETYNDGDWRSVLLHNIADVRRTRDLLNMATSGGVSESDLRFKML
jgi:hypothetical protein